MARRPDPTRSRVLLIGATRFSSPGLDNIPEIRSGLHRLRRALTDPGRGVFDPVTCTVVEPARTLRDVVDPFYAAVQSAEDVLLVYYAGHGILDREAKLHLAVEESDPQRPFGNSVDFGVLKREMERADARLRILWLDCCYSGQAIGSQSAALLEGTTRTEEVSLAVEH